MHYFVYVIVNKQHNSFYVGATNNLGRRMYEHKHNIVEGLSRRCNAQLVYFKTFGNIDALISARNETLDWVKQHKTVNITKTNPNWLDLTQNL